MESNQNKKSKIKRSLLAIITAVLAGILFVTPVFAFSTTETGNIDDDKVWGRFIINQNWQAVGQTKSYNFAELPILYPYQNVKTASKPYDRFTYFPTPEIDASSSGNFTPVTNPYKLKGRIFYVDGTSKQFDQIFIGIETAGSGGVISTNISYASLYYQGKQVDVLFNISSYVTNKIINKNIDYLSFGTYENPSTWWNNHGNFEEAAATYFKPTFAFFSTTVTNPVKGKIYFHRNQDGALLPLTGDPQTGGATPPQASENGFSAFSNYIFTTFQGILNLEFFGYFTIGDLFGTLLAITAVLIFLKFYAGG